jgi:uncharacterized protein (DUF2384 family)
MSRQPRVQEQDRKIAKRVSSTTAKLSLRKQKLHQRGHAITFRSVQAHALDTFGSAEKAEHWMNRPNPLFRGKTPKQVLESDPSSVESELVRIDYGVYV